ncbi:hypothetical protein [Streptomyces salyersiae]|uniref:Uncharacterized protein n=1 Tax=Streptomyces salyersiae TaxID=3075530 RepID=A0ABU2RW71_9ACTN|nr:hypothetical protein [Streptomyces sp. DSM 41770]MDT0432780.1 hypothetical protein [Streptomyces sp. DSM 41770]
MNTQPTPPSDAELIEHARTVGMVEPEKAPEFVAAFRAHVEERSAAAGTQPVPLLDGITAEEAAANIAANTPALAATGRPAAEEGYPCGLGVYCDTCGTEWRGDFIVTDTMSKAQRLDVVRNHARTELGWQCDAAGDFCPECKPSAPTAAQAAPGDLFTEAVIRHSAFTAAAAEATDAVRLFPDTMAFASTIGALEGLADRFRRMAAFHTTAEQPTGLTWEARAEHAVRLYARTAIELEDARADAAKLRERLAELEQPEPTDATERPEDTARRFARRLAAVEQLCSGRPGYHTITVKALLTAMSDADDDQAAEQRPVPAVGDRYVKRNAPDAGRIVTVNRVWTAEAGHTAVAYEWPDPRASYAGSACPLDVFTRTYRAAAGR